MKILKNMFVSMLFLAGISSVSFAEKNIDLDVVKKAENFFNKQTSMKADFVQTTSNGNTATGKIFLKKPGNMRIVYENNMELIADGKNLIYLDPETKQRTLIGLETTPAGVLVNKNLKLVNSDELLVKSAKSTDNRNYIEVALLKDAGLGQATFEFDKAWKNLLGWNVVDSQGLSTRFSMKNIKNGVKVSDKNFESVNKKEFGSKGLKSDDDYY